MPRFDHIIERISRNLLNLMKRNAFITSVVASLMFATAASSADAQAPVAVGDAKAGDRAAAFYTLLGNCRHLGIDAYAYLLDLFTRLPTLTNRQIRDITPTAWAARTNPTENPDKTAACQPPVEACLA